MTGFVKLYGSILHSSLWVDSDPAVKVVWITMLAMADRNGEVKASLPGIAHAAVVPTEDARRAVELFLAPDPDSRSKEHDGRRVEAIDGGWRILNHRKYREMEGESTKRVREYRRRKASAAPLHETESNNVTAKAEAEANTDPPPTQEARVRARGGLEAFDLPFVSEGFRETFAAWIRHRAQKRSAVKPDSETWKRQRASMFEMGEARSVAAMEHTMAMGWTGLREPSGGRNGSRSPSGSQRTPSRHAPRVVVETDDQAGYDELIFRKGAA